MDAAQVQQLIQDAIVAERAAVAAAAAANAAAAGPAGGAPQAAFARTPALAHAGVLDLSSSEGMKIYNAATATLPSKFSGGPNEIYLLLKDLMQRSQAFGWSGIIIVNTAAPPAAGAPPPPAINRNLLTQYGLISLEQLRTKAIGYEDADGRAAQDSHMMYQCIYNTMTEEAKLKVLSDHEDYEVPLVGGGIAQNGPLFLKVIIRNSTVDTMSTVFFLRGNLNQLKEYMGAVNCNIELFNQYVTNQVEALAARGAESSDLLINLFEAYEIVPDRKFIKHIEKKKDDYEDGGNTTPTILMHHALTKYKDLKRAKKWQAPSAEEEKIVALSAQVESLKKFAKKKGHATNTKESDGKKGKRRDDDPKYKWKKVAPKTGEPHTKTVNGKNYHWCKGHLAWTIHSNEECRMVPDASSAGEDEITFTQAMQAIAEDETDDEDSENDG